MPLARPNFLRRRQRLPREDGTGFELRRPTPRDHLEALLNEAWQYAKTTGQRPYCLKLECAASPPLVIFDIVAAPRIDPQA